MTNGNDGTILIIEDDAGVAKLQQRRLERAGYKAIIAGSAEEAMQLLEQTAVELVLLDYRLPGNRTGLDLYAQMKAAGHDLPVMIVTGFSDEATVIKALRFGVRDFVTKSVEYLEYLPEAVARVLKQVRTEHELAESEERFKVFMNNSPAVAFIVEEDGRFVYVNEPWERFFQRKAVDVLGKTIFEVWPQDLATMLHRNNLAVLAADEPMELLETIPAPDGVPHHWLVYKFPIRDSAGRRFLGGMAVDVTEKKKLEAQFLRAQRLESIGTLAGGIAHDLNNVLTPILMSIELLKNFVPEHAQESLLVPLQTSAQRGADMVKQVLSFARGVEGQRVELQLKHVIRDIEKMLRHTLPKSVAIDTSLSENLWAVNGDATQLHQVLMNLCVNARDAMPAGGRLSIAGENLRLDANDPRRNVDATPGHYVLVTVGDTGTGIPPDIVERIFDPFFTTKELGKGTGLGLSTSLGIVKSHGGFINVDTQLGVGTQFGIYLPAVETSPEKRADAASQEHPAGRGELILVVDDEASIREITKATLLAHGYRVLTAGDGMEALNIYARHPDETQVVLTDMMMPIMDGAALIQALRALKPDVRIIGVTGLGTSANAAERSGSAVQHFLRKPYTAGKLLTTLKEILRPDTGAASRSPGSNCEMGYTVLANQHSTLQPP